MNTFKKYIKYLGIYAEKQIEEEVLSNLPTNNNYIYLDCGSGDGIKTINRANKIGTKNILGVEVIKRLGSLAKKKNIKNYSFDLNFKWPLKNESVDIITATEVIEHLIDLDIFFSEAKRVLKTEGKLILSTENLAAYHNIFALILGNQPYTGPYLSHKFAIGHRPNSSFYESGMSKEMNPHLNVMTARALEQLLIKYGFTLKKSKGVGFYPLPPFIWSLLNTIDKYHSSYIVILASK